MNMIVIRPVSGQKRQEKIVNLPIGKKSKRLVFNLYYRDKTDMWYISIYEAQSGLLVCGEVPVVNSGYYPNDLFEAYKHKEIGQIACIPMANNPSTENPSLNNWDEFALAWGDGIFG